MEGFLDAYRVLGVAPDAEQAALKAAHRRLVLRHHPDLRPLGERAEATRRVQQINVAYGLVRDPERRAAYDRVRRVQRAREAAAAPVRRAGSEVAAADAAAAAQWEALVTAAGRWAGQWWRRRRTPMAHAGLRARRAAVDAVARVLWLGTALVGCMLGFATVSALQRVSGVEGPLLTIVGALSGLWLGSYRGWCRRLRMAGLHDPDASRRGTVARALAAVLLLGAALYLDARLGWA